jgi:hypothetical protein
MIKPIVSIFNKVQQFVHMLVVMEQPTKSPAPDCIVLPQGPPPHTCLETKKGNGRHQDCSVKSLDSFISSRLPLL